MRRKFFERVIMMNYNPFQSPESRRKRVLTLYEFNRTFRTRAELKQAAKRRALIRVFSVVCALLICVASLWFANRVRASGFESTVIAHSVSASPTPWLVRLR